MLEHIYFLEDGVCSMVTSLENGTTIETGVIGREGFVGVHEMLGAVRPPGQVQMQIAGYGFGVETTTLKELADTLVPLRSCLLRSVHLLLVQIAQTAACNRAHDLPQRLARWLLMCQDRVESGEIQITQEFLASMLGTHRSSVTVAIGRLAKAGLIGYLRGQLTIQNRTGLLGASCECYRVVRDEAIRLGLSDDAI